MAALSIVAYSLVVAIDGNGFVAAFVAGLAYSASTTAVHGEVERDFTEDVGGVLSAVVWFLFGTLAIGVLRHVTWRDVAFAVLALTVVRMVPVALALLGTRLDRGTVALLGWFGPRGLASVVFGLLAFDTLPTGDGRQVITAIGATVLLSVVLHGASAAPLGRRFARTHPTGTRATGSRRRLSPDQPVGSSRVTVARSRATTMVPSNAAAAWSTQGCSSASVGAGAGTRWVSTSVATPLRCAVSAACCTDEW